MLSQHHNSPRIGYDSGHALGLHQLVALRTGIFPSLGHPLSVLPPPAPRYLKQRKAAKTPPEQYAPKHSTSQRATTVGRESMMCSAGPSGSRTSETVHFSTRALESPKPLFSFQASTVATMPLTFLPRPFPPRLNKRCRALTDIDGEHSSLFKKKRRLRLILITSRLSPEFSHPATNIVDRGSSRIAVWAKQKALGRNLLRKAAILNSIRRRALTARETREEPARSLVEQEKEQKQFELAKLAFVYGSHDTHTRPVFQRTSSFPPVVDKHAGKSENLRQTNTSSTKLTTLTSTSVTDAEESSYRSPNDSYAGSYLSTQSQNQRTHHSYSPSPLGLSNYDALDLEEDMPDPYAHLDDDDESYQHEDMHDNEAQSASAYTPTSSESTTCTTPTSTDDAAKIPPQPFYSDFNIPVPGAIGLGDSEVDEGVWPNALAPISQPLVVAALLSSGKSSVSCSPNFAALFATEGGLTLHGRTENSKHPGLSDVKGRGMGKEKDRI